MIMVIFEWRKDNFYGLNLLESWVLENFYTQVKYVNASLSLKAN